MEMTTQSKNDSNLGRQLFGMAESVVEITQDNAGSHCDQLNPKVGAKKSRTSENTNVKDQDNRSGLEIAEHDSAR